MAPRRRKPHEEKVSSSSSNTIQSAHVIRTGSRNQVRIINDKPVRTASAGPAPKFQTVSIDPVEVEQLLQDLMPTLTPENRAFEEPPWEEAEEQAVMAELGVGFEDIPPASEKPARSGRGAGQNEMLGDWFLGDGQQFLREAYMLYSEPLGSCHCDNPNPIITKLRCDDCVTDRHFCQICIKSQHKLTPTHRISIWNGVTWSRTSLAEQGMVLTLNTHTGCLRTIPEDLLLGDLTGFHNIRLSYCGCSGAADKYIQLLRASVFPCSTRDPESGFTFSSLRMFDFLAADAKLSGSRYHAVLQRQNNNIEPHLYQTRLRELLRVTREWCLIQILKRAGQYTTKPDGLGTLAIRCPACPRLNFNYIDSDVQEEFRYLFAQQLSYDGSFQLVQKHKAHDAFDICLTDGLMYWVKQDDYRAHLEANKDTAYHQSTSRSNGGHFERCNNHRAANDTWVRRSGVAETGMGAVTCARHTMLMPIGAVSYWKGERYGYTDFSAGSQIQLLMAEGATEIGFFYDIYCQWVKNFWSRAPGIMLPQGPLKKPARFFGGVPKYHLAAHIDSCYALYSLNNMHGAGRLDAEGCERAWANLNGASGSTSEKGPGARIDSLNHIMNDWNWRKFVTMISLCLKKLIKAEKMAAEQKQLWLVLHGSLKPALKRKWESMSTEPYIKNKVWTSVFLIDNSAVTSRLRTVLDLNIEESARLTDSDTMELGLTAPTWISEGIDIEKAQAKIRSDVKSYGATPTDKQSMEIYTGRMALSSRITSHRQNAALFLDINLTLAERLAPLAEETDGQPEDAVLYLPSHLEVSVARTERSTRVISLEVTLRRAECYETLRRVRTACIQKSQIITGKKKNAHGEVANTRAQTMITRLSARVDLAIEDYSRSFRALKKLVNEAELLPFKELFKTQLKGLDSILRADRDTGQGRVQLPWFWAVRDNDTRNPEEAEEHEFNEAIRVEWFRGRERYRRWEEEVLWLRREIASTLFSYHSHSVEWKIKSESNYAYLNVGYKAYCLRQSDLYMGLMIAGYNRSEHALKASLACHANM